MRSPKTLIEEPNSFVCDPEKSIFINTRRNCSICTGTPAVKRSTSNRKVPVAIPSIQDHYDLDSI